VQQKSDVIGSIQGGLLLKSTLKPVITTIQNAPKPNTLIAQLQATMGGPERPTNEVSTDDTWTENELKSPEPVNRFNNKPFIVPYQEPIKEEERDK